MLFSIVVYRISNKIIYSFLYNSFLMNYNFNMEVWMENCKKIETSQLTAHIGFWMRLVSNNVSYCFARKLESSGVTVAEWVILRELYDAKDASSPSVVAELTGLTRGAISKLIDRLLKKGLVSRSEASGDRRYQDIRLTKAGFSLVPKLAKLADENDEAFFGVLTKSEREALTAFLKKMAEKHGITKVPID